MVSEKRVTGTAHPGAIVVLTGILGLRPEYKGDPRSCEVSEDGTAIWRLNYGITVTCEFDDDGGAHWHLGLDEDQREPPERETQADQGDSSA